MRDTSDGGATDISPLSELARYLYLMTNGLVSIRNYGLSGTPEEATYCHYVAEALHDLPDQLLRYGQFDSEAFWRRAQGFRAQIPEGLVEGWDQLFRSAQQLPPDHSVSWQQRWHRPPSLWERSMRAARRFMGRGEGASLPLEVAPAAELARYLGLLTSAFNAIRRQGLPRGKDEAIFCGYIADVLHNLPDLLLRYSEFDQREFWRYADSCRAQVAPHLIDEWDALFRPARQADE